MGANATERDILRTIVKRILPVFPLIVILLIWEATVIRFAVPLYVLPAPSKVLSSLWLHRRVIAGHAIITLGEALLGLGVASILGCVLAMLMDAYPLFRALIHPLLVASQSVPMLVLAPLFIIYLGFGMAPKVVTISLMCFFPIAVSFADGLGEADKRIVDLIRQMGASKWQIYKFAKIPNALTSLFSGLHVAATYSVLGAVVGEWLGGEGGLGFYMLRVKNTYMLDRVFAVVLVIILLSISLNIIFGLLKKKLAPWSGYK